MNDIPLSVLFGVLAGLLLLSAFFSGSETALMTINRYRLQHLVKRKHKSAIKVHNLLQRPDRLIGLILLGNNFVNILASSLTTVIAIRITGESGIAIAAGILTFIVLIFSEVAPKTLAASKPEILAYPAAWIYTPMLKLLYPVVWMVNLIANLLLRIFGVNGKNLSQDTLNVEELKSIVSNSGAALPQRYQNMLVGIIDLESATVEDIMTPRNEIIGINLEDSLEDIIAQIKTSHHTRLPVYKKSINRVIGFLHLRRMFSLVSNQEFSKQSLIDNLIKPTFIPASTPLHKQVHNFKVEKVRIGLVVDEYGDVEGIITLDDLLTEIVGELSIDEPDVKQQKDGSFMVDGSVTIRELNRITQWELPTDGPKTLNGLILEFMETIPKPGTSVKLHGYRLEIIERDGNAIKLVKFHPQN